MSGKEEPPPNYEASKTSNLPTPAEAKAAEAAAQEVTTVPLAGQPIEPKPVEPQTAQVQGFEIAILI